ncbi:MAG: DNA replication/repair protein RecF [Clostridia bacterium]|nr:DNA replication/repair protein RecF [Clostridia bacterium]
MKALSLSVEGFRNLEKATILFDEKVNIIYGDNGQGKTNILEALWLFTGSRSFRFAKDREMVGYDNDFARLELKFDSGGREQTAQIAIDSKRHGRLNGVELKSMNELNGRFCAVVFSPTDLSLVKEGPQERRHFIDSAICQVMPRYFKAVSTCMNAINQRNAILKNRDYAAYYKDMLIAWDKRLCDMSGEIYIARKRYIKKINDRAREIYKGISSGGESFEMRYVPVNSCGSETAKEFSEKYYQILRGNVDEDMRLGFTSAGVQKDDIEILIDGHPAKNYASQGQQRSAVLSMKLAEAELLKSITGEMPVAVLDDVMSELDVKRQDFILHHLGGWQVFITCCDPSQVLRLAGGKKIFVENGKITLPDE